MRCILTCQNTILRGKNNHHNFMKQGNIKTDQQRNIAMN